MKIESLTQCLCPNSFFWCVFVLSFQIFLPLDFSKRLIQADLQSNFSLNSSTDELLMVSFICKLEWPWGAYIKHYFWVHLWELFPEISIWITGGLMGLLAFLSVKVNHPICWGSRQNKRWRKEEFAPFFLLHHLNWDLSSHLLRTLDWDIHHWLLWFSGLRIWNGLLPWLSWASSFRQQIVGFLSLHRFCFSGEPWLRQIFGTKSGVLL